MTLNLQILCLTVPAVSTKYGTFTGALFSLAGQGGSIFIVFFRFSDAAWYFMYVTFLNACIQRKQQVFHQQSAWLLWWYLKYPNVSRDHFNVTWSPDDIIPSHSDLVYTSVL